MAAEPYRYKIQSFFYIGYYTGQPTAVFDSNTRAAVRSYQIGMSIDVTGELSENTLKEMFG